MYRCHRNTNCIQPYSRKVGAASLMMALVEYLDGAALSRLKVGYLSMRPKTNDFVLLESAGSSEQILVWFESRGSKVASACFCSSKQRQ